jgi:ATP-dependent helicase HepA
MKSCPGDRIAETGSPTSASQPQAAMSHTDNHAMSIRRGFVQVGDGTDGVGKLVDVHAGLAAVEYFESPAGPKVRRVDVPVSSVRQIELAQQTRVFWFDLVRQGWVAGRVDGGLVDGKAIGANEDHYSVAFPNGQNSLVPISQLYVRWSHPIQDPTDYLASRITDTPFFFDGRSQIVRHIAAQRSAFGGLTGLASAAVELLEHQVAIVRQVLSDPVGRYLLADEVGLGKTIEAGILIRQHVIDHAPEARVLVVTPVHLVSQWEEALADKFFLRPSPQVQVVPESLFDRELRPSHLTMLVVDEAHRIAGGAFSDDAAQRIRYDRLRSLASGVPRLLLLSGTPVLHQEDQFLAMLHLLDPNAYLLSDRDSFRRRVAERQAVAEAMIDLADDASMLFAVEAIDKLEAAFTGDDRLAELCSTAKTHISADFRDAERINALRALRIHVGETYRLHRRLLRTRRSDRRVEVHLPQRKGMITIEHADESRLEAFDFLGAWRLRLAHEELERGSNQKIFESFVVAALSHPRVLVRQMELRLYAQRIVESSPKWAFENEEEFLKQRRDLIAAHFARDDRAHRLADWFRSGNDIRKAIVFVDDSEVAEIVWNTLRQRLSPALVIRFAGDSESLRKFENNKGLSVLVCDSSVELGVNLQRCGAIVVHYDLPLDPARVEQRIGRVDRIEARAQVRNVVLFSRQPFEREWLTCLDEAVRIFNRSTAPLQYVLAEATRRVRSRLLQDGTAGIEEETVRLADPKTGLDFELRQIEAQEAVDAIEVYTVEDEGFFARMLEQDDAIARNGEKSLNSWVVDRLQFGREVVRNNVVRYVHDSRRPTLVPLSKTLMKFGQSVDANGLKSGAARIPFKPITFERSVAEEEVVEVLRVGHPFLDALESEVRCDDRGAAFALWRYIPRFVSTPRIFLRFDFLIEANLELVWRLDESLVGSQRELRRLADESFPVAYKTIWLTSDLEEVKNSNLIELIARPYSRHPRPNGSMDVNIRLERWDRAATLASLSDWEGLCTRSRKAAEEILLVERSFQESRVKWARRTRDRALAKANIFASRIALLSGSAKTADEKTARAEAAVYEALAQGIEQPHIRVDSAGLVILAGMPLVGD